MGRQGGVGVLDCRRVTALRLRLPATDRDVLVLDPGVHAVTPVTLGAAAGTQTVANIYVDSRGTWLQLREGLRGAYVNGRAVQHMAMLRAGDALYIEGVECVLLGREATQATAAPGGGPDPRAVLRSVAGRHHGRCFALANGCTLGRSRRCDIILDDEGIDDCHVEIRPSATGWAIAVHGREGSVTANGNVLDSGQLRAGDQLVVAGQHRFIVECARQTGEAKEEPAARRAPGPAPRQAQLRRAARRLPWLLLAAVLLAAGLSLLLVYGAA